MRVVIFGSRYKGITYDDANVLKVRIWNRIKRLPVDSYVITGGATGVDSWALYARNLLGLDGEIVPAKWRDGGVYNPWAGFERNSVMLSLSPNYVIGYWDGLSNGTKDTAEKAVDLGIRVEMHTDLGATVIDDWRP